MWRILVAVAAAGALSAVAAVQKVSDEHHARGSRAAARGADAGPAGSVSALHSVAAIAADQARTLRRDVRRCGRLRSLEARTRCDHMALAHAAAGAKLNAVILRAGLPGAPPACARIAARLAGLMGALSYVAVDGTRSAPWPARVRADARAAAAVAGRVPGLARSTACVPGMAGPRA